MTATTGKPVRPTHRNIELTELEQSFNRSVRRALQEVDVTQEELGSFIGVKGTQISGRLRNRIRWTLKDMHLVAGLFGITPMQMIDGSTDWLNGLNPANVRRRLENAAGQGGVGVRDTSAYQGHTANALAAA